MKSPKKTEKQPEDMTADEIISHVFDPDVLKHLKEHIEKLPVKKRKPLKEKE